jgi:hypothetical protein
MSVVELYHDYNIEIAPEGSRHYHEGWINTECPFCGGSFGYHLGFKLDDGYYHCYRCGGHSTWDTLPKLLGVDKKSVGRLIKEYKLLSETDAPVKKIQKQKINLHPFKYPTHTARLGKAHKRYLRKRNFDPDYLEKVFDLKGTGPNSRLDEINYNFRIISPIYWNDRIVSFHSRDYTEKQEKRHLACPMRREEVHHKHIIYSGKKLAGEVGLLVEGVADVWRLGRNAIATFGIEYTPEQVKVIAKSFKKIFIIFDPERQAQRQAKKMESDLCLRGIDVDNILLDSDPGDLRQDDADYLVRDLLKKY